MGITTSEKLKLFALWMLCAFFPAFMNWSLSQTVLMDGFPIDNHMRWMYGGYTGGTRSFYHEDLDMHHSDEQNAPEGTSSPLEK